MPPQDPAPPYTVSVEGNSESSRENAEVSDSGFYTDNFTHDRPPYLNHDNISSLQPYGSLTQYMERPRSVEYPDPFELDAYLNARHVTTTGAHYAHRRYTPSSTTNSTVRGRDPYTQRPELSYVLSYDNYYNNATAAEQHMPQLTEQNIAHVNSTAPYDGNIHNWLPGAGGRTYQNQYQPYNPYHSGENSHHYYHDDNWSTRNQVLAAAAATGSSRAALSTSLSSSSSWSMVPPSQDEQRTAELLRDVGHWSDIPADPNTTLASLRDEDMWGTGAFDPGQ
ncbi:uncharacterized protein GGS25DRAFT_470247 [Hypoxylon fragiforme]|uniref:uncharacterized protein n=1 Tax=Hypoxylon fragiforme TaxID=63214 RepID=UPI0020C683C4|nr:uncharacterized protein GGS25DRAFT_470247 [Hypoxylon fragiforme]KAI2614074.1 hypothetical protein GGS25DRAFT_470247 [Hypoxylon fragiforme]